MKEILEKKIQEAVEALQQSGILPDFSLPSIRVERPKDEQFGEYTTNVALILAKLAQKSPLEIAEALKEKLTSEEFEKIVVVAPGHINFYLAQKELATALEQILKVGEEYGASGVRQGIKVNNEFISANPTGPLHLGNARGGFYAHTLSNVLQKSGYDVINEYYINDAGEQTLKLGHSVLGDSEAVYTGEYIDELRKKLPSGLPLEAVSVWAAQAVLHDAIEPTVENVMKVHFDVWTSEKQLITDGFVEKALAILEQKKLTYRTEEGTLWLKTTEFGDDKDRVLVKENGVKTYFASDCGYILSKMERGFAHIIETWGADHHGYIGRFKAAAQALGFTGKIDFIIVQLVKVVKDGKEVRMSKRVGNVVTIDELVETVGLDVARFFFLMYAPETHMNFDLGIALERSQKNPVFYVQYAHARLCSILRKAEEEGISLGQADLLLLTEEKERALIRELMFFPELLAIIAEDFAVHKLPQYAMKLSDKLHSFYDACRVIDGENVELTMARLQLIQATRVVLAETLTLMGISAPEKM